jgi:hypothetical protein
MATYPVEFHRRLEQKWESRIAQILSVTGTVRDVPMMTMMMTRMQTVPKSIGVKSDSYGINELGMR